MFFTTKYCQSLRQLFFPKEFRIAPAFWESELLPELEQLLQTTISSTPTESETLNEVNLQLLTNLSTGLWRLKKTMVDCQGEPLEQTRRPYRRLESVLDALTEFGIQIQEHAGDPYIEGLTLNVLTFQPKPDIDRERIAETIKPSIYFNDKLIQVGEVIVERPLKPGESL